MRTGRGGAGSAAPTRLRLEDLHYDLPAELIAQHPVEPRDASRLLVYERRSGREAHHVFRDLPGLLRAGDVVVRNDTRVFPARSFFRRCSGGRIEALFLRPLPAEPGAGEPWEALLRGRPRPDETLTSEVLGEAWPLRCERKLDDGRWVVSSLADRTVFGLLEESGLTPLPPYIHEKLDDPERYQTTYARVVGSAAAPTAGLHFTPTVDRGLADAGVSVETLTLHVGLGTFKPLDAETLAKGRLHSERYALDGRVWGRVRAARAEGRRVIAVGTTSMRVLETLARREEPGEAGRRLTGETDLFIAPGFCFHVIDGLLTNFHLPRSSLLALVMAFCGREQTRALYRHAIEAGYRFYSLGDAMLIV